MIVRTLKVLPVPGPPVSINTGCLLPFPLPVVALTVAFCCSSKSTYPVTDSGHFYLNWTTQKLIQSLCQLCSLLKKKVGSKHTGIHDVLAALSVLPYPSQTPAGLPLAGLAWSGKLNLVLRVY